MISTGRKLNVTGISRNVAEGVEIGRIAAGTTVTREMLAMVYADYLSSGVPRLWIEEKAGVVTTFDLDAEITVEIAPLGSIDRALTPEGRPA